MHARPTFAPDCPGPVAAPRRPRSSAPDGACDCHFHVFGPYDRFPLAAGRGYTPPEAPVGAYRDLMATLGLDRCVIVQPSIYGTDNRAMLAAAEALGGPRSCRVVAVLGDAPDGTAPGRLRALHDQGVRGVRFNLVDGGGPLLERLGATARRIADLGWHIQIYSSGELLAEASAQLAALPVDLVIDHFGAPAPAEGLAQPAMTALLRLLDGGRTWVKLSGGYIASQQERAWDDMAPFARRLAGAHPEHLLWGTNWPHPLRFRPMPDDGELLDALEAWLPDEAIRCAILVENPARLYQF